MNRSINRIRLINLLIFLVLVSIPLSFVKSQKKTPKEYREAVQYIGTHKFDIAIQSFKKIIVRSPDFHRTYAKLVIAYKEKNQLDTARLYFEDLIKRNPGNPCAHYGLGLVWKESELYDKAIQEIQMALQLNLSEPEIYEDMVDAFQQLKKLDDAHKYVDDMINNNPRNAAAYYGKAYIYKLQINWAQSTAMLDKAIMIRPDMCHAYFLKGWIYALRLSEFKKALSVIKKGINYAVTKDDFESQAKLLRIRGTTHYRLGNYAEAYKFYTQAKKIFDISGDKKWIETIIGDIGLFYFDIGDYVNSEKFLKQSYEIACEINDRTDQARHLNNLGNIMNYLGKYPEAFDYFERALAIDKEGGNEWGAVNRLGNLSDLSYNLGNYDRAKEYEIESLNLAKKIGDRRSEAICTADLGRIYLDMNENEKALELLHEAIKKSKEINYPLVEMNCLQYLGDCYFKLNNYDKAREYYNQALLQAAQNEDIRLRGYILNNLGRISYTQGNYSESSDYHKKALAIGKSLKEVNIVIDAQIGLAYNCKNGGKYQEAIQHYKNAEKEIEKVRDKLKEEENKLTYLGSKFLVYEELIDLYSILNKKEPGKKYDRISFKYVEKAKARGLLDIVTQGKIFSNLSEIPSALKQDILINGKELERMHLRLSQELSKPEQKQDKKSILFCDNEINRLQRKESQLLQKVRNKFPRYYQLTNPRILESEEIQRHVLRNNQVLVEYLVAEENTFIWIVTKSKFAFKTVQLSKKDLESMLLGISPIFGREKANHEVIVDHRWANINMDLLNKLYKILLESPTEGLLRKDDELIIVPDGILHYFPFEMLVTGIRDTKVKYLIEEYPISYSSSASMLNPELIQSKKVQKDLLAFGNPDFTGENKNGILDWIKDLDPMKIVFRNDRFEPLPNAELEVKAIAENFTDPVVLIGKDATEVQFKKLAGNFRYIHLATHYLTFNEKPMYSKIVLAQNENEDGYLQTYEVYNLRLNAEIVVLSGCSTGLGKLSRGEGLIGMTRAFQHAGVSSIVVSLWPVEDASTASFMNDFYNGIKKGMNRARALQQAKINMIRSSTTVKDPFYWSTFVLIGNSEEMRIK